MAKMLKSLLSVFLAVFMVVSLAAIPSSAAVALSKSTITLTKGYQTTLSVTGTTKTVEWSTGDKSIATVNSKGTVVGKAPGTTYVYAKVNGTTLKCKVTVVAAKITASASSVTLDKRGSTKTITIEVKGSHSGLTVGTTNKSVATASWVKPVQWNGDKISYTITAQGAGNARIKVYLKDYPNTCYNFVDVTVGGGSSGSSGNSGSSSNKMAILPYTSSVDVAAGGTYALQVYSTNQANLAYSVTDKNIATVSAGNASGYYRNFTIKGVKNGTTTLRLYDKNNTSTYYDVKINVNSGAYYEFYTTMPVKQLSTDKVMTIQISSTSSYYMLVPDNYDPAYVNSLIGQKFGKYSYYEVSSTIPLRTVTGDSYYEFYHTNSKYNYGMRYVLLPKDYDSVQLNTAVAKYNGRYEYWTVYSENPTKLESWDEIVTWQITDALTGKFSTRYLLVPSYNYDADRISSIKDKDIADHSAYTYYVSYATWPTVNNNKDQIIMFKYGSVYRYMVVPKDNSGIAKANDAIAKETGIYEYNVIYSTQPTAGSNEKVVSIQYGTNYYYVLIKSDDKTPDTNLVTRYANGVKDD